MHAGSPAVPAGHRRSPRTRDWAWGRPYTAASEAAEQLGSTGSRYRAVRGARGRAPLLANRGFVETERNKMVRLDLAGMQPPEVRAPAGILLTTLAQRPQLVQGVWETALEAFPDIPADDEPMDVGTIEAFVARDVDRVGIPKDAFFVAVAEATGDVVGYASLIYDAASTTLAYHDMTAVRRAHRGRGIATALKPAAIAWAVEHGLEALDTGNDEENAPMRAVNLALGYRPVPDWIGLQGPLAATR